MKKQIIHANIILPDRVLPGGVCCFTDGIIDYIGTEIQPDAAVIDAHGAWLLPGFVDIHCHGGSGYDFMDAEPEEMRQISRFHLRHGTTTLIATTMTDRWAAIEAALDRFAALGEDRLTLEGVHLEGPWLNPAQCGAQDTEKMSLPDLEKLRQLKAKYPFVHRVSAAPELPRAMELGAVCRELGIVLSAAHTDADFDQMTAAAGEGYTLMTHLYSGMGMTVRKNLYRVAGAVEAGLYDDRLTVELIADGKHLPDALLKLVYKCKGANGICLVTDAIRGAGLPEGTRTKLGAMADGMDIVVEDGVAKLADRSSFAGSVATADRLLRTMQATAEDLVAVSRMLSGTPARIMGYADRGSIERGKRADLVLLNENYQPINVFLKGESYEG